MLLFVMMGNTATGEVKMEDVLKKVRLPKTDYKKYNIKKMKGYIKMLEHQIDEFERYGQVVVRDEVIIKKSENGKYITAFGVQVPVYVYKSVVRILKEHPDYAIKVMLGIFESLGKILEFLGVIYENGEKVKAP